ncbi:MAG: electron transport complex subunit RsxC [Actinomycetota bacterium]|nr:electron transport complex subunit RsxC [Actinomycetota bacterium]
MTKAGFRGGVHPPTYKDATCASATQRAPIPQRLVVPMSQHLGAPCAPLVAVGDRVERGQPIGDVDAMVSAPVHSPVAGEVAAVSSRRTIAGTSAVAVEIVPDPEQDFDSFVKIDPIDNVATLVRSAGIVGMGGAAFPAHVKLSPPKDATIEAVILNGCECEPFLTCDHRTMLERATRVVEGSRIIARTVGATRIVIGIEDNKPDAIAAVRAAADTDIEVLALPTSYPQGAEKQLIWAVMAKEVPHGKLPSAAGALVHNVGTAAAIADAVLDRRPLMERVVTVSGMVSRPGNYLTLLGTPLQDVIDGAGGFTGDVGRVIAGGPMTGMPVVDFSVPVVKGTSGVVALAPGYLSPAVLGDQPCIRCGRCTESCPMLLEPFALGIRANRLDWDGCENYHGLDCIECGCCSYVCPTRRPLVQLIRRAKHALLERGARS